MPKLWELLKPEAKTKVMALRHYLEKKEKEETMRKDGNKLVVEEKDINTVLAFMIRDYQFTNQNELPEVVVVQCGANVKSKDRNDQDYEIPMIVEQDPLSGRVSQAKTGEAEPLTFSGIQEGQIVSAVQIVSVDYLCPECKRTHRVGSKIHKRHLKLLS